MQGAHDNSIIRPRVLGDSIKLRGEGFPLSRLKKIKRGLITFHTLEVMAVNIYKFQITKEKTEHNRQLIAAMMNEMTHVQDFQVKLYEYGWKPSLLRFAYLVVGFCFGFFSKILGKRAVLKTGIWVESKAVDHYKHLLQTVDWDDDTRKIIEKDGSDEDGHIARWRSMLTSL